MSHLDEEFNNFMHKVTEVSNIVQKLASTDENLRQIGDLEAKRLLGETDKPKCQKLYEEDINLTIRSDRTVINKKALLRDDNPETQSKEAFMEEVSRDADRRYKDKLRRRERMETFKKQATLVFRRREYEKALSLYNKAIEQIRDSAMLYCNRALTYINLTFYDKAVEDCQTALQLNENSLKAGLLLAKAQYLKGALEDFSRTVEETRERNKTYSEFIDDFVENLSKSDCQN